MPPGLFTWMVGIHTAEPVEDRARRDGGAAASVVDQSRRGYTLSGRWRTGPTQRRRPVVDRRDRGVLADIKPAAGVMDRRWSGQSLSSVSGVEVYASLDCSSLPDHATHPLRLGLEWGVRRRTDRTAQRWGQRRARSSGSDQDVQVREF
jgi:hypothetical protein